MDDDMKETFKLIEQNEELIQKLSNNRKKIEEMKKYFINSIKK